MLGGTPRPHLLEVLHKWEPTKRPLPVNVSQDNLGRKVKHPSILDFPNEILLLIAENLEDPLHIYRLVQTNHHFACLLTPLLHKYAVLDREGIPALHWAAIRGHEGLVRLLLQKGVDVNLLDINYGWTALHLAAEDHEPVVRVLLENGADFSIRDSFNESPLQRAIWNPKSRRISRLLVEAGADVNVQDFSGNTPLHRTIMHDGSCPDSIVQLLLDMGADVSLKNMHGRTAVHNAVWCEGSLESLVALLKKGDALNEVDYHGRTALHYAVAKRSECLLLAMRLGSDGYKIDVNIQDENGETPLHIAAVNGNSDWVGSLLKAGADPSIRDNRGKTAHELILKVEDDRVVFSDFVDGLVTS